MDFKPLLKSALGEEPCDLLFKNAKFANLCTMEYETGGIAVKDGVIVGIGGGYRRLRRTSAAAGIHRGAHAC